MIELKHIYYTIKDGDKEKTILEDINCIFDDDCVTAITGQNGSGKSTLTKLIMGIINPTSGKIYFNNIDITDKSVDERAKMGLTYAFQQPITFRGITIKELIDIASNEDNSIPKACEYLSKVGICAKDYINREFDKTLSGGEQKRIELALTLAKCGKCIIFDEPEAGIDLWSFERLNNIFEKGICYIVVSHQTRLLERADKILVLDKGKIKNYGISAEVIKHLSSYQCKRVSED